MFTRSCPECSSEISYKTKAAYEFAEKAKITCRRCTNRRIILTRKPSKPYFRHKDMIGMKFGKLTALERIGTGSDKVGGGAIWRCECDCGKEVRVLAHRLRNGNTRSCGCLLEEYQNRLPPHEAAFHMLFKTLQGNAKDRGLDWGLSEERTRELAEGKCYYCGVEPRQVYSYSPGGDTQARYKTDKFSFTRNGIDRVNNSLPYQEGNVVSCCGRCNRAKMNSPVEEFMEWVHRIVKYQSSLEAA